ncbi:MAG: thioredoxin family protein [Bacteroidetes bacterium]|nr:thioredoxin family protein [Bacteroidota bacterium]MBS1649411.1 thioredoxin family protein [Bacteroidota bacterium]
MKKIIGLLFFTGLIACSTHHKIVYQTIQNGNEKILKGYITRKVLQNDSSFKWFNENMQLGQTDASAVAAFSKNKNKFTMIIFCGTWCHDTQFLLPQFYKLVDESHYPDKNILLLAVDENKQTINNLQIKYAVTSVPTFIVLQNEKEVARVVEYGKYGLIDKELGEIVSKL